MSKIFNITLKVPGIGNHNILYLGQLPGLCPLDNIYLPNELIINGISQDNINYTYYFNETENNVIIRYYSQEDVNTIPAHTCFFYKCPDITEIDLSEFDTSQSNSMYAMFSGCTSLKSLNLNNIKTPLVKKMDLMFLECFALTSIDLSTFDTRNVENMERMFEECTSLTSLNLSNFEMPKLFNMNRAFYNCHNLEYLNLKEFDVGSSVAKDNVFYNITKNIVLCTNSNSIKNMVNSLECILITCDENWKEQQSKINTENNECTNDCLSVNYKYLYGSKCINNCPIRTFNNNYICEDCHEDCSICFDKYSDDSSNCITCLDNNKFINFGNCVSSCENGYYDYYNETLNLNIKTCKCDLENCLECTKESLNNNLCITCNNEKGYYPIDIMIYLVF